MNIDTSSHLRKASGLSGLLAGLVLLFLNGCATTDNIPHDPSFWQQNEARIGVAMVKYPEGAAYKGGAQGLLDMAINAALSQDLSAHMKAMDPSGFSMVADTFVDRLQTEGFAAKKLDEPLDLEQFAEFEGESDAYAEIDLRNLAEKEDIDLLVLLSVERFGTIRNYYGFLPLGPPQALFEVKGQLVDLTSNDLKWQRGMRQEDAVVPIDDDWDQPPSYPHLSTAFDTSIERARAYLERHFFTKEETTTSAAVVADDE